MVESGHTIRRSGLDDRPLASKKFIAYLVAEISWKILTLATLFLFRDQMTLWVFGTLMSIIITAGFVEAGYIIGQASLDRYVRVAEIAAGAGQDVDMKNLSLKAKKKEGEKAPQGDQT